jgi:OFA family oxalate/formate antiporter-like MFS transporter
MARPINRARRETNMTKSSPSAARGWTVVAAALSINLLLGVLYAWSVMGKALVAQWGWTRTNAMWPFAISAASFAVMMIFAGRLQDRIGPRYVAMLGGIVLGAGLVASSFARTPLMMLLTFGVLGGIGIGLGYSATTPPSIKWFPPARKGLITGLVVSGVGLAAVYMSPLTDYLIRSTSIQQTFLILGVATIVLVSLLAQVLANPPVGYIASPGSAPANAQAPGNTRTARQDYDWPEMLRTPQFYQLWLTFILCASAGLLVIGNVAIIAKDQAHWERGYLAVMTVAVFNTCGRVVSGFLSDRLGRSRTMLLASIVQAVNMFAFLHYTTPPLLLFGAAVTGLCYGTVFTLFPAATADFYGVRNLGVNYGLVFTAFGVAGVTGSVLGGKIRDVFGSYSYAFTLCGVMLVLGSVLALLLKAPKTTSAKTTTEARRTPDLIGT